MTSAKAFEGRIIREVLSRRVQARGSGVAGPARESDRSVRPGAARASGGTWGFESNPGVPLLAERCIAVLAATAGVFLIGSVFQELLWALLAAGTVITLGK
ncbi:MAG: hypothetical protein KDI09_06810 [Halioglobus sp.]|nr:hypothetical protein [Halioglobus sp.]